MSEIKPTMAEFTKSFDDKYKKFCLHCGMPLGYDCGEAEPDYNKQFCSVGCYKRFIKEAQRINKKIQEEQNEI